MTTAPKTDPDAEVRLDAAIIGGGIAGLWLTNLFNAMGYRVVLFEAHDLGCQQTLASQGMIHGGLKYALGGKLTLASEAISRMPARWRQCLAGEDPVDLTGLTPLSERYYMFAEANTLGRLTTFFASKTLRGRISKLAASECPGSLRALHGSVYELDDFVLDTQALMARLLAPVASLVYRMKIQAEHLIRLTDGWSLRVAGKTLRADRLILAAGTGTRSLLDSQGISSPQMQIRPLHQVIVRHAGLEPLYAHCLTGVSRAEPRLTITSHPDPGRNMNSARWLWYLGGALATRGAGVSREALIDRALNELEHCVPWIDWTGAEFETLRIDRAEPAQPGARRPDEAFAELNADCIVCWPTKLSLAPDLGDKVVRLMSEPRAYPPPAGLNLPEARVGQPPWQSHRETIQEPGS